MNTVGKQLLLAVMLMGSAMIGWTQSESTTNSFDLEQCVQYALEHNQNILNASLEKEIAQKRVKQTIADGLPQINGNLDLGYNFKVATSPFPDFLSPAIYGVLEDEGLVASEPRSFGVVPAQFGTNYTGSVSISLQQMIFNGSYFVGLQAARTFTELSRKDKIKTEIDVVNTVSKAYYLVLVNREREELINKNYSRLDTLLHETEELNKHGFAEEIDVNRVKVQFNNIKVEKDNYDDLMKLSISLLKYQMGMPVNDHLMLSSNLNDVLIEPVDNQIGSFEYSKRIEFSQLQTNKDLLELDIKNTNVQRLPQLNLYGSLGATSGVQSTSDLFKFSDNWFEFGVVGVKMNVPIFDGFRKSQIIQQKKLQAIQLDNSFEMIKNGIDVEIEQANINYKKAFENMNIQKENISLAERVYDVARIKYQQGVGANLEVVNADADFKQAQTNYYDALFDALVAKIDLQKAYGTLLKSE